MKKKEKKESERSTRRKEEKKTRGKEQQRATELLKGSSNRIRGRPFFVAVRGTVVSFRLAVAERRRQERGGEAEVVSEEPFLTGRRRHPAGSNQNYSPRARRNPFHRSGEDSTPTTPLA